MNNNALQEAAEEFVMALTARPSIPNLITCLTEFVNSSEFKYYQQQQVSPVWVKASERLPDDEENKACKNHKCKTVTAFYTKGGTREIEFEDNDDAPDWVTVNKEKQIITLNEGWYEEVENVGYYDYMTYPRKIVSWLDESKVLSDEDKPKVICFCGSTRFAEYFMVKRWELEKQGVITFGINILPENYFAEGNAHGAEQEGVKEVLDELHKRKIDLSDEVFVLNVGGYIGESTRNEINYAISKNKPIKYLE